MLINDFEKMGIALADARMLCQRFLYAEKVRELAEIMSASEVAILLMFPLRRKKIEQLQLMCHYIFGQAHIKKHVATRIGKGGGTRANRFDRTDLLEDIFQYFKQVFFRKR